MQIPEVKNAWCCVSILPLIFKPRCLSKKENITFTFLLQIKIGTPVRKEWKQIELALFYR
jgi:hypothetical protein